jgi:hypothetical protein
MGCDWCERPVGASHAVTCPLKGYVTEPAAPSEGGTGDEIAKLRAEIARLRKTADGQIRSRVAEDIAVESAWERCGITPHWPDDEAGSIVSHAESMAMEIARLREENRLLIEDRSRFPDKPDGIGRIIAAHNANREAKITDLENRCRDSLSEIARLREERRWVPVGERVPDDLRRVMVMAPGLYGAQVAWLLKGKWHDGIGYPDDAIDCRVTHWMPLPPGPEGDG